MCVYLDVMYYVDFLVGVVLEVQLHSQWKLAPAPPRQVKGALTKASGHLLHQQHLAAITYMYIVHAFMQVTYTCRDVYMN